MLRAFFVLSDVDAVYVWCRTGRVVQPDGVHAFLQLQGDIDGVEAVVGTGGE